MRNARDSSEAFCCHLIHISHSLTHKHFLAVMIHENFIKTSRRDNERKLSSRDIDNLSESSSVNTMNLNRTSDYGSDASSGRFSSALNRLKYSDYKPLMRTFTRRFDSPPKVNICVVAKCLIDQFEHIKISCRKHTKLPRIVKKRRSLNLPQRRHPPSPPSRGWSRNIPTFSIV